MRTRTSLKQSVEVRPCIIVGGKKLISVTGATRVLAERLVQRHFHLKRLSWYSGETRTKRLRMMKRMKRRLKPYVSKILTGSYS